MLEIDHLLFICEDKQD